MVLVAITEATENEIAEATGNTLTPEQKQRILLSLRAHIQTLDGLRSGSIFKKAVRWTVCIAGLFVLMSTSKHVPKAGFGATFRSLAAYVEAKTIEDQINEEMEEEIETA